jgi:hypothetical protein
LKKYIYVTIPVIVATVLTTMALLLLTSVGSVNSSTATNSLAPLDTANVASTTTTTIPSLEDLPVGISGKELHKYYIAKVKQIYGSTFTPLSNEDIVGYGLLWCDAINLGMKSSDVEERINEGAVDNDDAALQRAIVASAVLYLCPQAKL